MSTFRQRKTGALEGFNVLRRDDLSLQQWSASDRWNHTHWDMGERQPAPTEPIYAHDDGLRSHGSNIDQAFGPNQQPPITYHGVNLPCEALQATRNFNLYQAPVTDVILMTAPDQSRYSLPNRGDLGRMMF